jgi:hypothetical protein
MAGDRCSKEHCAHHVCAAMTEMRNNNGSFFFVNGITLNE